LPLVIAPVGGNGLLWPAGDLELAKAAAAAGIPMAQSTVSMTDMSEVAGTGGLRHWFQIYAFDGERVYKRLIERAVAAGSEALVITVDGAVTGNREWDQRSYTAPHRLSWRSRLDALLHPDWLIRTILIPGMPNLENLVEFVDRKDPTMSDVRRWIQKNDPRITWKTVARMRELWPRKLLLKGILRTDDVLRAIDAGVDGVVLSNHGGRQLEPTISPLEILRDARRAAGEEFTIVIDSGFRRGSDVAVALALGADAVMLGRAALYGLAAGGQIGASKALDILRSELDRVLALIGVSTVRALAPDALAGGRFTQFRPSTCEGEPDP
jgi:(S)-mandelate dehydrogenase